MIYLTNIIRKNKRNSIEIFAKFRFFTIDKIRLTKYNIFTSFKEYKQMFTEYEIQKIIRENIELREENSKLKITIRQLKSKKTALAKSSPYASFILL